MITTQSRRRLQTALYNGLHFLDVLRMLIEGQPPMPAAT
jgi:hypothetical protein